MSERYCCPTGQVQDDHSHHNVAGNYSALAGADDGVVDIHRVDVVVACADSGVGEDGASQVHEIPKHDDAAPSSMDGPVLPLGVQHPTNGESRSTSVSLPVASPEVPTWTSSPYSADSQKNRSEIAFAKKFTCSTRGTHNPIFLRIVLSSFISKGMLNSNMTSVLSRLISHWITDALFVFTTMNGSGIFSWSPPRCRR